MTERASSLLLEGGSFFEGPRWHDARWWVSDFYRHVVLSVAQDGSSARTILEVPGQPSGLGWLPDGSLLFTSMKDQQVLRRSPSGAVAVHADLSGRARGQVNDMVVDARGRAFVGCFGFDLMAGENPAPTSLWRIDPDGTVAEAATGMLFPNGAVVTPDGSTLIVGESFGCRYTAFTITADGTLLDRRVWAQLAPTPELGSFADLLPQVTIAPDGCGLDARGHIWCADAVGRRCLLVAEGGSVLDEVRPPDGLGVYACMLGGADGRTLLLCCAPDYLEDRRAATREAVLLTTTVDVPHAGLP